MFKDRKEAGELLAKELAEYKGENTIVYALPWGGVVLGYEVAKVLGAPLDLIITRKIGHPHNPEYGICAVAEEGEPLCEDGAAGIDPEWLRAEVEKERAEAQRRRSAYLGGRKHFSAKGKIAIVVDDGVATGLTLRAALRLLYAEKPEVLIAAVPVAPHETVEVLRGECDKVVVLLDEEEYLGAVGSYYEDFPQVTDEEVIELMQKSQGFA